VFGTQGPEVRILSLRPIKSNDCYAPAAQACCTNEHRRLSYVVCRECIGPLRTWNGAVSPRPSFATSCSRKSNSTTLFKARPVQSSPFHVPWTIADGPLPRAGTNACRGIQLLEIPFSSGVSSHESMCHHFSATLSRAQDSDAAERRDTKADCRDDKGANGALGASRSSLRCTPGPNVAKQLDPGGGGREAGSYG
jgi:hypothetical protein